MNDQTKIVNTLNALFADGVRSYFSTKELYEVGRANGFTYGGVKDNLMKDRYKAGRGKFDLRSLYEKIRNGNIENEPPASRVAVPTPASAPSEVINHLTPKLNAIMNDDVYIPDADSTFVPWGEYKNVKQIIESRLFFPLYINGMSGNGKTMMVEQACAKLKREYVRVQISPETDEDDLIGGFRLINGETVFHKGPVIKAMERGCILLIDELDRGSNKIMCLQGVLEGKPVLIKKIGQVVYPANGFNVIATANTKGRGSEDGRYSAANIIDEAFIERFVATIDQPYPDYRIESNIVSKHMDRYDIDDSDFTEKLVSWSSVIRKTYENEGVDELISTRRLCHIVKAFSIFRDRMKAINMCINRFEAETREAFLDLYTKIDSGLIKNESSPDSADSAAEQTLPKNLHFNFSGEFTLKHMNELMNNKHNNIMTKTDIKKVKTLLKQSTQKEAVYAILADGYEPSVNDLKSAGIADPHRVVNQLRNDHGFAIYLNDRKDRRGNVTRRYRLGTPRRNG